MGRKTAAPIDVNKLRAAIGSLLRAACTLERYEELAAEQKRGRPVLQSRVCSPEQADLLRRVFRDVVDLGTHVDHLNPNFPLLKESPAKKNVIRRSDAQVAMLVPKLQAIFNAHLATPNNKEAELVARIVEAITDLGQTVSTTAVKRALPIVLAPGNKEGRARKTVPRMAVVEFLDALGLRGSYADRVERKLRSLGGKNAEAAAIAEVTAKPFVARDLEPLASGVLPTNREVEVFVEKVMRGTQRLSAGQPNGELLARAKAKVAELKARGKPVAVPTKVSGSGKLNRKQRVVR